MEVNRTGKVWLVGAGPGDAGLMTIRGLEVLNCADVVVYDALIGDGIGGMIPANAKQIYVGKRAGAHEKTQEEINDILLKEALKGNWVVRLKGGDPFVFGRGGEELALLVSNQIPFEIVPGVTSAVAVPAYNGIPVTHRGLASSLHIITGHTSKRETEGINFNALSQMDGTLVFLMGLSSLGAICNGLINAGMSFHMPAAVLEQGTMARQRKVLAVLGTLEEKAKSANVTPPAIIIVGNVCNLADSFSWQEKRPLWNKKILVTRPKGKISVITKSLRELGAEVTELPTIELKLVKENSELSLMFQELKEYHWLVVTSPSGVEFLFEYMKKTSRDIRMLHGLKLACVGKETKKVFASYGLLVDYIPSVSNAGGLGEGLSTIVKKEERVLILRARKGTAKLTLGLAAHGISYKEVVLYETTYAKISPQSERVSRILDTNGFDYIIFTSGSTVRGFVQTINLKESDFSGFTAVCIGSQTAEEAMELGMNCLIARESSMDSIVELIRQHGGENK